jgi:hypothetical protein
MERTMLMLCAKGVHRDAGGRDEARRWGSDLADEPVGRAILDTVGGMA